MNRKRIFQYSSGEQTIADKETRWIAADSKEDADNYAFMQGWRDVNRRRVGDGDEILEGHVYDSVKDLLDAGVDVVMPDGGLQFVNHYDHCDTQWTDTWSCACDDECPVCGADIEPHDSEIQEEPIIADGLEVL